MPTMINCPYCGKLTDPQLDSCVHCFGLLKKQSGARPARRSSQTSQTCPKCGALVKEGDIICVACGTNLLTGQKVAEQQRAAAPVKVAQPTNRLNYIIGGILALIILALAVVAVVLLTGDAVAKAKRLAANGRMSEAIELLEQHVAEKTDDANAHFELGKLHWLRNTDLMLAAQSFEKAARLDERNTEAAKMAVLSYGQVQTQASRDAQLSLLERVTQSNPGDTEMLYLLGLARGLKSDFAGQVDALSQAAANDANPNVKRAEAVGLALQNDLSGAETQLGAANPTAPDTLAAAGIVAAMQGDKVEATAKLQAAVEAKTAISDEALTRLGLLLIEQGNFGEAYTRLNDAVTMNGDNMTAKYFRAVCMDRQQLTSQALAEYEALVERANPYQTKAAVQAARMSLAQQNSERALQTLGRVPPPSTPGDVAELETVRGRAYMLQGDVDSARDAFRKATQADPNYAPGHLETGLLLIQRQDIQEGVRELERYLNLVDETDPDAGAAEVKALIEQLRRSVDAGGGNASEDSATTAAGERDV